MLKMISARIAWAVVTLFLVSIIIFVAIEALPGDMATAYLGRDATPESLAFYREEFGLNRPLFVRYFEWFGGVLQGDFGTSPLRDQPITELIKFRMRNTVILGLSAALIGIPLAIFLGVITALNRDKFTDVFFSTLSMGLMTLPEFVIGTFLIFFLAIKFRWLQGVTLIAVNAPISEIIPNITLPVMTLTCILVAHILRLVRTSLIDVMQSDYVLMAQFKGAPTWRVVLFHALPNAMLPSINIIALTVAWLLGGSVIIESIFNYPGIGSAMLVGITARDFMLVQAIAMALAIVYIGLNLTADLLSLLLNPKLRTTRNR